MKKLLFVLYFVVLTFDMTYAQGYENTSAKINTRIGELESVGG